jgi:CheY-like chemotaxis protein
MAEAKNWRVLVVDDEPHNINVVRFVLEFHKAHVESCNSGRKCLELLERSGNPDLVLLDIQMPEMDGFQVLNAIRSNPKTRDLLVIAVTALAMPYDYDRGMAAGFDGYITKPVNVETFMTQIKTVVNSKV